MERRIVNDADDILRICSGSENGCHLSFDRNAVRNKVATWLEVVLAHFPIYEVDDN